MKRLGVLAAMIAALSACDNSAPAGGRGYFDPAPPAPVINERRGIPEPGTEVRDPFATVPSSIRPAPGAAAPQPQTDGQRLAQDVTQTLAATRPGGIAPPAPLEPSAPGMQTAQTAPNTVPNLSAAGQPIPAPLAVPGDAGINPNDDSINLNLTSQEVQVRQREVAARQREAARQQLVIVAPEPVPQQDLTANVVRFARETTHPVGTKMYNRPAFRDRRQANRVCARFANADEAQRQFLSNGGPVLDRFNIDPDGDGFACGFNPDTYRRMNF